jgi:carnitine-CoA ligase
VEYERLHPFFGQDLTSALEDRVRWRGDHPFMIWKPTDGPTSILSYRTFGETTDRVAAGLAELGVALGSRVLVMLDNCPEMLLTLFACARLGATAVTVNTRSVADEVEYYASHSESILVITDQSFVELVSRACPTLPIVCTGGAESLTGVQKFTDLLTSAPIEMRRPADPSLDLSVQYTSGTTARPKGVVWTHANALWGAQVNARHTGLRPEDVYLVHLPLFHTNALGYSVLGTFWVGGTIVLVPKFSASRFWPTSLEHGCTVTSMIPFCIRALAGLPVPIESSYRTWGSPICDPPSDALFNVKSVGWWGMTETISHGIVGDVDQPNMPMTCGRPALEYELRILDDQGDPVSAGQTGALQIRGVRGVSLFSRYLNDEASTASAFDAEGFFLTGDRVTLLAGGHIAFADRDKDMLKVAGENVAASEVERVIAAVRGVSEVAVVAKPDPMRNEVPVAFVTLAAGAVASDVVSAIHAACAEKLADFKVPQEVRVLDDLPRATLNKVAKAELRTLLRRAD